MLRLPKEVEKERTHARSASAKVSILFLKFVILHNTHHRLVEVGRFEPKAVTHYQPGQVRSREVGRGC